MNLYIKSFICGFFYVFGFSNSPVPKDIHRIIRRDDRKALSNDWMQVGKEVMKAYEASEKPSA